MGEEVLVNDKYIKYFRAFVAVALVGSLAVNFTLLSKISQLENRMNFVTNHQQNIMNELSGQTSHIQTDMNDIKQEQSWISTIKMELNKKEIVEGQADAIYKWQVKELQTDSEVFFNYAYGDSEDYITLTADELQQGMFQVKVPIEVPMEPLWDYGLFPSDSIVQKEVSEKEQKEMSEKEMEQKRLEQYKLKYFVSVSYGDMVKSGEIHTEHLEHFGTNYYGIIQTDLHMDDENFDVAVTNHNVNGSSNVVEEAYLLKYEDETFIGEEEIQLDEQDHIASFFYLNQEEQYEDMRLVIKVVYSDGATFEKEVY
jgi:hypothetical protein